VRVGVKRRGPHEVQLAFSHKARKVDSGIIMGPSIDLGAVCTRQQRLIGTVFATMEMGSRRRPESPSAPTTMDPEKLVVTGIDE
jgi:hypothetical protein